MRLWLHIHAAAAAAPTPWLADGSSSSSSSASSTAPTFFLSHAPESDASASTSAGTAAVDRMREEIQQVLNNKRVAANVHTGDVSFVVERAASYYRVATAADVCELRDEDSLHACWQADAAALQALQPLAITRSTRPLTQQEKLLAELDAVPLDCHVPRAEPLWLASEVLRWGAPESAGDAHTYGLELRKCLQQYGFIRLKFDIAAQLAALARLLAAQLQFFALPVAEKLAHTHRRHTNMQYQTPFGYSSSAACNKQFFVVRQAPAANPSASASSNDVTAHEYALPANPADFAPAVSDVFRMHGAVCEAIMRLLLRSWGASEASIAALLKECMSPPQHAQQLPCTSVIELFKYRLCEQARVTPAAATAAAATTAAADGDVHMEEEKESSSSSSSAAAASSSAAASSAPPAAALPRPVALPCAIHSDASLLTLIPRCAGAPGLQLWNLSAGDWQACEAQSESDEAIVFGGDMLGRLCNDAVVPANHRVCFVPELVKQAQQDELAAALAGSKTECPSAVRYSAPFELFLTPSYTLDLQTLWKDSPELLPLREGMKSIMSAQDALYQLSQNRVSVNKQT